MSDTSNSNGRGRSEGSRRHQFSRENQPARRRQRRPAPDMQMGLLRALRQPIIVTKDGKTQRMTAAEVLTESTIRDLIKAPVQVRLKALAQLKAAGVAELMTAERKLEEDRLVFEREKREWERHCRDARILEEISRDERRRLKTEWVAMASLVTEMRKSCECGGCERHNATDLDTIERALRDDLETARDSKEIIAQMREWQRASDSDPDFDEVDGAIEYEEDWDDPEGPGDADDRDQLTDGEEG